MHISVLNGALWNMEQGHYGSCEIGLFQVSSMGWPSLCGYANYRASWWNKCDIPPLGNVILINNTLIVENGTLEKYVLDQYVRTCLITCVHGNARPYSTMKNLDVPITIAFVIDKTKYVASMTTIFDTIYTYV